MRRLTDVSRRQPQGWVEVAGSIHHPSLHGRVRTSNTPSYPLKGCKKIVTGSSHPSSHGRVSACQRPSWNAIAAYLHMEIPSVLVSQGTCAEPYLPTIAARQKARADKPKNTDPSLDIYQTTQILVKFRPILCIACIANCLRFFDGFSLARFGIGLAARPVQRQALNHCSGCHRLKRLAGGVPARPQR
jgi:hypothetical protein